MPHTPTHTTTDSYGNVQSSLPTNQTTGSSAADSLIQDSLIVDTTSLEINKTFGATGDYIELHVYNSNNDLIESKTNFTEYSLVGEGSSNSIELNPTQILQNLGYTSGFYRLKFNVLKNKIFDTNDYSFHVKEISSNRKEIRSIAPNITNEFFDPAVSTFIADIESSVYFKEFSLNLGFDQLIPCVNVLLNKNPIKHEILFKTLNPLSNEISIGTKFKIVEEIVDPFFLEEDLGSPELPESFTPLRGPNFNIEAVRQKSSIPGPYKSYDQILNYNFTSSYEYLLSKLEDDGADLNIRYDYIRPVSESSLEQTYHFENFVHFGSAVERVKNFRYKLKLIEKYDNQISSIENITGPTSNSVFVTVDKNDIYRKKEKIIKGFDGYEQFLYFDSGTFAWPKTNTTRPYNLYSVSSSQAKLWVGSEDGIASGSYYGGQLLSASLFDRENVYNLNKLIPAHIADNTDNNTYISFVNMVGQHFDHIWTYIKSITEIHNPNDIKGVSKDVIYFQLKSLGIETFDQFENDELLEYFLGAPSGSQKYSVNHFSGSTATETLVTASNDGSLPKGNITKEIWKRLFHNAPYLLKTKGTERGIRALMSCYGIPSTILNIKEYGGSTQTEVGPLKNINPADFYKTFKYNKSGLSLKGASTNNQYFIKTNWSSSLTDALSSSAKTIEFRIKPLRTGELTDSNQHLLTLSGSTPAKDISLVLNPHGSNDIFTTNDATTFGKLDLIINNEVTASTPNIPLYNGDFWNIFIGTEGTSGSSSNIKFGAYQANFLGNILHYTASYSQGEVNRAATWGDPYYNGKNDGGAFKAYFCGVPLNTNSAYNSVDNLTYSGSLQEIKYHFHQSGSFEILSHFTLKKHALEPFMYSGNHITSSFNEVVLRLPLGSNDHQDSSSFHPNIDVNYLGTPDSSTTLAWKEVIEEHHLPTPDTVGRSWSSEKVRIDEGTIEGNQLSLTTRRETSTLDRQPPDYPDLGIFFSPTEEINEDILYTLGSFRLDDYIGSPLPSAQTSSKYEDLKTIKDYYFKKVKNKFNYFDYIKLIQQIDHTLFKIIENFIPNKAYVKSGLLIEPHYLERTKFKRTLPVVDDLQTMVTGSHQTIEAQISTDYGDNKIFQLATSSAHDFGIAKTIKGQWDPGSYVIGHNNPSKKVDAKGYKKDQGTNTTIKIYDDYIDPINRDKNEENNEACQAPITPFLTTKPINYLAKESSVLLGNATKGRRSNKYYKYTEYFLQSSSLYTP